MKYKTDILVESNLISSLAISNKTETMLKKIENLSRLLCAIVLFISCGRSDEVKLFNGTSLEGWEGSDAIFRVEEGAIVGGSLEKPIDKSYYLCTEQKFENFELKLEAKFISSELETNGGISFRARRVPNSHEVMGYQADIGYIDASAIGLFSDVTPEDTASLYPLWGCLVDESRPNTSRYPKPEIFPVIIFKVVDKGLIEEIVDPTDWNEVRIRANGPNIEISINGVTTATYTEKGDVPKDGCICLQTHGGDPFEVWYKNIVLNHLDE